MSRFKNLPDISPTKLQEQLHQILECLKCQLQYVGKSETEFNIRLNNHRKDFTRKDSIPASNHFDIKVTQFQYTCEIYTYRTT